jgi:phosphatidylserine/phosphatidylglycerophosphate/cardiolipin synthase-like enzyme/uncharacterized membrane protein YdjX (TVP38/TMEM64 family)
MSEHNEKILVEGENCWKHIQANRASFITESDTYYAAFRKAVINARHSVCILAWDLMEDIELLRGDAPDDGYPRKFADFLYAVADANPELEIRILVWDYSMVYIVERDWLPFSRWKQDPHPRIIVQKDEAIHVGASHHQKVVVIDGNFAFCGGLDFSAWRWDTKAHEVNDSRRKDPKGEPYQPYHDAHMAVTGDAALALGDLFISRWKRATGESLESTNACRADAIWPELDVDMENVECGVALTYSEYKDYTAIRQIEKLHLDLIKAAERYIYIENQYLSSHTIAEALADRLREADGPEIVIVLTQDTGGWIEEGTLGLLRNRLLEILEEADAHGRLGVYYPFVEDESGDTSQVYVHAKLMICDDNTVEMGSANLSNRSMKVDSEVDLVIVKSGIYPPIQKLLRRLLAIHFSKTVEDIHRELDESDSINSMIKKLQKESLHQLRDLKHSACGPVCRKLADSQWLDPDEPIAPSYWIRKAFAGDSSEESPKLKKYLKYAAILAVGILFAYGVNEAWGSAIDKESLEQFFSNLSGSPWVIPALFGSFFLAGLVGVPINLLLVAATLTLGPWLTFSCGFTGSLCSAIVAFLVGHWGGKSVLQRFIGDKINKLSQQVGNRGVLSVALIRVVPVAPFVVVNLVAGISKLKLRVFFLGSILGMLPGMLGVVLVTHQARSAFTDPTWQTWALLAGLVAIFVGGIFAVRKYA